MESKHSFTLKIKKIEELSHLTDIKKSLKTKGILCIRNCELNEDLKKKILKEENPFIENAFEASLINFRKLNTTAVLLTFNLQEQPCYVITVTNTKTQKQYADENGFAENAKRRPQKWQNY